MLLGTKPVMPLCVTLVNLLMPSIRCMSVGELTPPPGGWPIRAKPAAFRIKTGLFVVPMLVKNVGLDIGFRFGIGSGVSPRAARVVTREVWMFSGLELVLLNGAFQELPRS